MISLHNSKPEKRTLVKHLKFYSISSSSNFKVFVLNDVFDSPNLEDYQKVTLTRQRYFTTLSNG